MMKIPPDDKSLFQRNSNFKKFLETPMLSNLQKQKLRSNADFLLQGVSGLVIRWEAWV